MSFAPNMVLRLSGEEFIFFQTKIKALTGISLSESKLDLVQGRLRSRVLSLGFESFSDYREYLQGLKDSDEEWQAFINLLTTNKTEWFRESGHFDYILNILLPKLKLSGKKHFSVWCAASSTGEEPYTLALVLKEALSGTGITFEVTATDIDTKVLALAKNGVYSLEGLKDIPEKYHKGGFIQGTGEIASWIKVRKEIKEHVKFQQMNLSKFPYGWSKPFDLVLCRNVLIYFNSQTVADVAEGIFQSASKDSILIIGHSESLHNMKISWKFLKPSIYVKGKPF